MFDELLKFIFKATNVAPEYTKARCLAVKQSRDACTRCRDVCPHEAITIRRQVLIDEVDCTGCGLCVQVCPSQALEPKVAYAPHLPLKCSRVAGEAQTVHCLGRLRPSDLLRLAGPATEVRLARGDCADCPVGTALVKDALATVIAEAEQLAAVHERELRVEVRECERFDDTGRSREVSRRDLLRGGWRNLQRGAADALAPLDPGDDDDALPREMQRHYRLLEAADPAPETPVPWALPRVADGCIMCPVCTNVCPTKAFSRDFRPLERDPDGSAVLHLDPERCVGCEACVSACPVKVISMDSEISWGELSGGRQEAFRSDPEGGVQGSVARR